MTTTDIPGTEKIAVAQDGSSVSPHFGHCESYAIFQIENGAAVRLEDMENPGHEPGKLPLHLAGTGITTVLAGGIGQRALAHLQENGVTVIRGVSGEVNAAAAAYAQEHSSLVKTPADVTATGNTTDTTIITATVRADAMKKESITITCTTMDTAPAAATDTASNRKAGIPSLFWCAGFIAVETV